MTFKDHSDIDPATVPGVQYVSDCGRWRVCALDLGEALAGRARWAAWRRTGASNWQRAGAWFGPLDTREQAAALAELLAAWDRFAALPARLRAAVRARVRGAAVGLVRRLLAHR